MGKIQFIIIVTKLTAFIAFEIEMLLQFANYRKLDDFAKWLQLIS